MNSFFEERRELLTALAGLRKKNAAAPAKAPGPASGEGLFLQCPGCAKGYPKARLRENCYVCPDCGYHMRVSASYRLRLIFDGGEYRELDWKPGGEDPLRFPGYREKLESLRSSTGLEDAAVAAAGRIAGIRTVAAVLDCRFLMGSMGTAVGEKITRTVEYATRQRLPLVIFSASGGARMQEGIFSLMQMAKTSGALERHSKAGLLYLSCLCHPTTGGVTASFASLGDVILAEPGALIGFAGPRVIRQTIGQELPPGFQRAEFLEEHGFVDRIVDRRQLRETLSLLLRLHGGRKEG